MSNFFVGHQRNWRSLVEDANSKRLPPSYLFYGLTGIGKRRVALRFAQYLFCRVPRGEKEAPCGECGPCQKVEAGGHPDLSVIECLSQSIKIDDVRNLVNRLYKAPLEAFIKVVIIDDANELTTQAGNALLKTLEEPPSSTLFILIAPNLFQILPTIRSRCRKLFFGPPPADEIVSTLMHDFEGDRDQLKNLLEVSEGSPGLALTLTGELYRKAFEGWGRLKGERKVTFSDCSGLAQEWSRLECDLVLLLEILKKESFRNFTLKKDFVFMDHVDLISKAQKDLERHVNKALVLENLFLRVFEQWKVAIPCGLP